MEIIPAILEKTWEEVEKKIKVASLFSNWLHIDFIDGKFVGNKTFLDPNPFSKYSKSLFLEAHLMVEEPVNYLDSLAKAGFRRFIGQIEKMSDQIEFVAKGEILGEVGLALDGPTSISDLQVPTQNLDIILFMAIKAGFSGQEFSPSYIEKIKDIKFSFVPVEIDGGINDQTILIAIDLGANIVTPNSYLFNSEDPAQNYLKLKELARLAPESTQGV